MLTQPSALHAHAPGGPDDGPDDGVPLEDAPVAVARHDDELVEARGGHGNAAKDGDEAEEDVRRAARNGGPAVEVESEVARQVLALCRVVDKGDEVAADGEAGAEEVEHAVQHAAAVAVRVGGVAAIAQVDAVAQHAQRQQQQEGHAHEGRVVREDVVRAVAAERRRQRQREHEQRHADQQRRHDEREGVAQHSRRGRSGGGAGGREGRPGGGGGRR